MITPFEKSLDKPHLMQSPFSAVNKILRPFLNVTLEIATYS